MALNEILNLRLTSTFMQLTCKRQLANTSRQPRPQGKNYRLWAMPGDEVYQKDVLVRQYTMKWHPGLNSGIDEHRTIYALCDGIMIITEDKFDPDWTHPLVQKIYMKGEDNKKLAPLYKRYVHVIPRKRISEFKLIDIV